VPRPPFRKTLREFPSRFANEEACQQYLAACRWPDGLVCRRCGSRRAYELVKFRRWQCTGCRHQVSLTAGTVLHNTKTPLTVWFWAAYLMTTDKRGISALLLQRRAIGNLQQWMIGTYHGVSRDQLQVYLDEFVFRHNRRRLPKAAFQPYLASEPSINPRPTNRYEVRPTFLSRPWRANLNLLGFTETTG
jgi:transposase-like protein